jgi:hypothetical protein
MITPVSEEKELIKRIVDKATKEGIPQEIARGVVEGNWDDWKNEFKLHPDKDKVIDLIVKEVKKIYLNAINSDDYGEVPQRRNPYMEHFPISYSNSGLSRKTIEGLAAIARDLDYELGQITAMNKNELLLKVKELINRAKDMDNEYAAEWLESLMEHLLNT